MFRRITLILTLFVLTTQIASADGRMPNPENEGPDGPNRSSSGPNPDDEGPGSPDMDTERYTDNDCGAYFNESGGGSEDSF